MKNFLTVFALMVSVSGIAVSLAREEVRCYLGLSSSACHSTDESHLSPRKIHFSESDRRSSSPRESSTQKRETQQHHEQTPENEPLSRVEETQHNKEVKDATPSASSNSSQEVTLTDPSPKVEEPPTAAPEVTAKPTEPTKEVSASSSEAQPLTHSVELEVIPPPEDHNSTQPHQNH
ncbi:hypothetical protein [Gloeothece verrucosa]|uniref:Uncharacterized protein n=1 Tax=Gloeothece verrucosa (strain PCC 7822) TaxID=497965 RepID=E0UJR3_GLOV7|nr:hypothetical protein [Gloeothece verrucosa]ADN13424.1 conserved hypothetical protein [Gloeothece verrucosa PCC 7822]